MVSESDQLTFARLTGILGRRTIEGGLYLVDLTAFVLSVMKGWRRGRLLNRATYSSVIGQTIFTGVDALPTVTLLSFIFGVSITAQLITILQAVGSESEVVDILTRVVALELGPLLTAIVVIGRSGSAIAVDLGNMRLNREMEGLELLGMDVNSFFITPRLIGVTVSQLVLAVYFSVFATVVGLGAGALFGSVGFFKYLVAIPLAFDPLHLLVFLIKNLAFGLIVGATACFHGLQVTVSSTEVPQQTQRAIVNSLTLVFILDGLMVLALL